MSPELQRPSRMAEGIALHRASESAKPPGERILYDPYAAHFVNPATLAFQRQHPQEARAALDRVNALFPGLDNSIRARVRYIDDCVREAIDDGIGQLVILGAGYDTRAYRIDGLKACVNVFDADRPATLAAKKATVRKIFHALPGHVAYVPFDLESDDAGRQLAAYGYDPSKKTLFVMEGLLMYLSPDAARRALAFAAKRSGDGSAVVFDYYPRSVVDGTGASESGKNIRAYAIQAGEPLKFGIEPGEIRPFLASLGFVRAQSVSADEYRRLYFRGVNQGRPVCDLLYFARAAVDHCLQER